MDTAPATPAAPGAWTAEESQVLEGLEVRIRDIFDEIAEFFKWMSTFNCLKKLWNEIHNDDFFPIPNGMVSDYIFDLLQRGGELLDKCREFLTRARVATGIITAAKETVRSGVVMSVNGVVADARVVAYRNYKVVELIQNWEAAKLKDKAQDIAERMNGVVWTESQRLKEMALHHVQNQ